MSAKDTGNRQECEEAKATEAVQESLQHPAPTRCLTTAVHREALRQAKALPLTQTCQVEVKAVRVPRFYVNVNVNVNAHQISLTSCASPGTTAEAACSP
ncbi:MAG: hypothetical protein ACKPKO_28925, partial [Candidatus Fonsibacter sp.]